MARPPEKEQIAPLIELFNQEAARYQSEPAAAKKLATEPLGPLPSGLDTTEMAAWTVVANVLLNMDSVLTDR